MPTYAYSCTKCGEQFEVYQTFSDKPLKRHDACGGKLQKVFSPVGIVLKGSGFYKTDSRSASRAASKASESKSSESKSDGSSDSKPDTKSDATVGSAKSDSSSSASKRDTSSKQTSSNPAKKSA